MLPTAPAPGDIILERFTWRLRDRLTCELVLLHDFKRILVSNLRAAMIRGVLLSI